MTPENSRLNAAEEARQGREVLAEARHLLEGGFFKGAVSRAYFSSYHLARALLVLKGLEPKTHAGVIRLFSLHYVKAGVFPPDLADYLSRLETFREICDYDPTAAFSHEEAAEKILSAESFIARCEQILREEGVKL